VNESQADKYIEFIELKSQLKCIRSIFIVILLSIFWGLVVCYVVDFISGCIVAILNIFFLTVIRGILLTKNISEIIKELKIENEKN